MKTMRDFGKNVLVVAVFIVLFAALAMLPFAAPPAKDGMTCSVYEKIEYDNTICVLIQGEQVVYPGTYRVSYDCTYGELFDLAGFTGESKYVRSACIAWENIALVGGEYCVCLNL